MTVRHDATATTGQSQSDPRVETTYVRTSRNITPFTAVAVQHDEARRLVATHSHAANVRPTRRSRLWNWELMLLASRLLQNIMGATGFRIGFGECHVATPLRGSIITRTPIIYPTPSHSNPNLDPCPILYLHHTYPKENCPAKFGQYAYIGKTPNNIKNDL